LAERLAIAVAVVGVGVDAAGGILDGREAGELVEGGVGDEAERGQDGRELRTVASLVVREL
jgi:hypothetical protein